MYRVKKPPRLRTLTLALLALLIGAIGLGPYLGPMHAGVAARGLELRAGFWLGRSTSFELEVIESAALWDELPRFERHISGYSFAGRVRGEFVLAGLGEVFVFLENERPPYVFVRGRTEPGAPEVRLLLSFTEAAATRALFRELSMLAVPAAN